MDLDDLEKLKHVLIEPMIDGVRTELQSHLAPLIMAQKENADRLEGHQREIDNLKGAQKKALIGWGAFATVFGIAWGSAFGWIKGKLHLGQ